MYFVVLASVPGEFMWIDAGVVVTSLFVDIYLAGSK